MLDYYVVLRSVLRDRPEVRRLRTRCRHCGIFFIADPRNAGREDLGCPFGCADAHRRQRSTERSVTYNRSEVGQAKRRQREVERRLAKERLAPEVSGSPEACPVGILASSAGMTEPSAEAFPPGRGMDSRPSSALHPPLSDPGASISQTAARGSPSRSGGGVDPSLPEPGPGASAGSPPAESEHQFPPRIVGYVRMVISLLEKRNVSRLEILEMLARTRRQHSLARQRRIDYVLRRLSEEPEKPP